MKIKKEKPSQNEIFRKRWLKKGYELVNITTLCEPKMGTSGWHNNFNEPDETIHHIQLYYRDEIVANINGAGIHIIDDDKYVSLIITEHRYGKDDLDFIIFKKCKIWR